MDNKAFYKLSYGVFVLGTAFEGRENACVTNTCIQVASNPTRVAISVLNTNFTCDLLKKSGRFAITLLDDTVSFDTIKYFGMQSGRDVDKFGILTPEHDAYGMPYISWSACAVLSARVVSQEDLGSHTLFIAEVEDAQVLSANAPLTYADYQSRVKPKPAAPAEDRKPTAWKCRICGYVYEGAELPKDFLCPLCGHPAEDFEPIYG